MGGAGGGGASDDEDEDGGWEHCDVLGPIAQVCWEETLVMVLHRFVKGGYELDGVTDVAKWKIGQARYRCRCGYEFTGNKAKIRGHLADVHLKLYSKYDIRVHIYI